MNDQSESVRGVRASVEEPVGRPFETDLLVIESQVGHPSIHWSNSHHIAKRRRSSWQTRLRAQEFFTANWQRKRVSGSVFP
jgi:hypothetical protein